MEDSIIFYDANGYALLSVTINVTEDLQKLYELDELLQPIIKKIFPDYDNSSFDFSNELRG